MQNVIEIEKELVSDKSAIREKIMGFEKLMTEQPDALFGDEVGKLRHSFGDGIYVREMSIRKGTTLTGKLHKYAHPYFLMSGEIDIVTEGGGVEHLRAPMSIISPAGTKRVIFAIKDSVLVTCHHNPENITDTDKLVDIATAENYLEYEKFAEQLTLDESKKYINAGGNEINNCGLTSLRNLIDLKNVSAKTLIDIAGDNGLKIYSYKVSLSELNSIPLPAIVHSENHFDYIGKRGELKSDVNYTGNILLTQKVNNYSEVIDDIELKNITGSTMAVVGLISAGVGLASTVAGGAMKGGQAKRAQAAARRAQLVNDAVAARKAINDAKAKEKTINAIMIIGASLAILGIGVAFYVSSLPKPIVKNIVKK